MCVMVLKLDTIFLIGDRTLLVSGDFCADHVGKLRNIVCSYRAGEQAPRDSHTLPLASTIILSASALLFLFGVQTKAALFDTRDVVRVRTVQIRARNFRSSLDQHVLLERRAIKNSTRAPSRRTKNILGLASGLRSTHRIPDGLRRRASDHRSRRKYGGRDHHRTKRLFHRHDLPPACGPISSSASEMALGSNVFVSMPSAPASR